MAKGTTLAAVVAEVERIQAYLDQQEQRNAEAERHVLEILERRSHGHRLIAEAVERSKQNGTWEWERPELRVIAGSATRRTKRRGQLTLVGGTR